MLSRAPQTEKDHHYPLGAAMALVVQERCTLRVRRRYTPFIVFHRVRYHPNELVFRRLRTWSTHVIALLITFRRTRDAGQMLTASSHADIELLASRSCLMDV